MFKMFKKKKNNTSAWTFVSLIGLGTAIGMLTKRNNQNMMDSVQNTVQKFQDVAKSKFEPKINLANLEIADELTSFNNNIMKKYNNNPNNNPVKNNTNNQNNSKI
jgi:hypothetical protein